MSHIRVSQLEEDWRADPAPEHLAEIGLRWLREGKTAVLTVPSAVIPQETNYLLNPRHPTFGRIRTGTPQRFSFDPRMS